MIRKSAAVLCAAAMWLLGMTWFLAAVIPVTFGLVAWYGNVDSLEFREAFSRILNFPMRATTRIIEWGFLEVPHGKDRA